LSGFGLSVSGEMSGFSLSHFRGVLGWLEWIHCGYSWSGSSNWSSDNWGISNYWGSSDSGGGDSSGGGLTLSPCSLCLGFSGFSFDWLSFDRLGFNWLDFNWLDFFDGFLFYGLNFLPGHNGWSSRRSDRSSNWGDGWCNCGQLSGFGLSVSGEMSGFSLSHFRGVLG
jgi:hypothetical protein